MQDTKLFTEWEKQTGIIVRDASEDLQSRSMTFEEFTQAHENLTFQGVNHDDRIEFLKANGYPVTRENMTVDLSARPRGSR